MDQLLPGCPVADEIPLRSFTRAHGVGQDRNTHGEHKCGCDNFNRFDVAQRCVSEPIL
jgi:hypothetical protein